MIIRCHPVNPEKRVVKQIVDGLSDGKIYIVPTDTVYAFICSMDFPASISELYKLKSIPDKQPLSLLVSDVAMASKYARSIPTYAFRFMKSHTPGPYTFILKANREMNRKGTGKRQEVGIRIVNHPLHIALMEELNSPLIATSITDDDEFMTDPENLDSQYGHKIEAIIDGGIRNHEFSSVLDCTEEVCQVIRQGIGNLDDLIIES